MGWRIIVAMGLAGLAMVPRGAWAACNWDELTSDGAKVASIGGGRTYFIWEAAVKAGCPSSGPECRRKAYLNPGDVVLTGPVEGAFTCAGFVTAAGETTLGWLPGAALRPLPDAPDGGWTGDWVAVEQDIKIAAAGDALKVDGSATWGSKDPERVKRGGVNLGEVSGRARPEAGVLAFTMGAHGTLPYAEGTADDCRIRMVRRGPYLVARDNNNCGGMNVSFSGFYRRR